eukprot:s11090_g2.t1
MDLRAHFSLGPGPGPPRDPLGPAAFGYLSGSYSILLRSRSLGAAMADAPDPGGAKDDAAPAAATPPDQGSAMELELSQALIELRRLTLFQGPALGEAIPRYFSEEQLRELMARLEDAQLCMRDLREEKPAAATRASSAKGRAWLARGVHLRPLRGALQEGGVQPSSASFCRGTRYIVELFVGRTRPPLPARANAKPQGKGQFTLDLTWTAIDRDLWPLGSWNKSLGEQGPKPRYEGPKGKGKSLLPERAIWHAGNNPEVLELTEADRQLVCRHLPATFPRAEYLATELLPIEAATLTR